MSSLQPITLSLDRRILEHPRAYHLRRMRAGIWLYLDLLARLPAGAETFEVEPAAIGRDMGLPEGTVRSWLGHLRKAGYLDAVRLNGKVRVTMKLSEAPGPAATATPTPTRFFTVAKIQRALGETSDETGLQAVLDSHSDEIIKRAIAGTLAVPETQIRRSRTALFIYLLKRHAQST
jgi:DNA-binding transcriptional ArsR family regulator